MKEKENKSANINFRVTDWQKKEIDANASAMNLSTSGYLSHLLSDYEGQKKECQVLRTKNVEFVTQKGMIEAAMQDMKKESELLSNSSFTRFYESVQGKMVGNRLIKSKADLLGVMTSGAEISVVDDGRVDIKLPLEVRNYRKEKPEGDSDDSRWYLIAFIIFACALAMGIYLGRRSRSSRVYR